MCLYCLQDLKIYGIRGYVICYHFSDSGMSGNTTKAGILEKSFIYKKSPMEEFNSGASLLQLLFN